MISSFFITIASSLLAGLVFALPASSGLPDAIHASFVYILSAINSMSYLIPVGALFASLGIVVAYEAAIWLFFGGMWLLKRIPILGR